MAQPAPLTNMPASPPSGASISHVDVVLRMLWLCSFCVLTVVGGLFLLGVLPQIQEALWAFDDGGANEWQRFGVFVGAFLYWALTVWFVARLLLGRDFKHDTVGTAPHDAFTNTVALLLPRVLGCLCCFPIAIFMLGLVRQRWWYAALLFVASLAFLLLVWRRRSIFGRFIDKPLPGAAQTDAYRYFHRIGPYGFIGLALLAFIPFALLLAIVIAPIGVSRFVGTPAIILFALGAWTLVGGMGLTYLPKWREKPSMSLLPLVPLVLFGSCNDNHPVAWRDDAKLAAHAARPALVRHFDAWMQAHPEGDPVYFVAVAGGASRASYWAGVTLGGIEDHALRHKTRFGRNIFVLSSVSGGSVGAAAFVSALATWPEKPEGACIRWAMDEMLGRDVLAPVVGMMLFPDLLQRLLPDMGALSRRIDRSRGLEDAWARDWLDLAKVEPKDRDDGHCRKPVADLWTQPLAALHAGDGATRLPSLVLNTARLEDGRRMVQSNMALALPDADDLLTDGLDTAGLTLAGAVHNSARFPYVSPPGTVRTGSGAVWGHLGDGGYHEATGAASLADILQELQRAGRLVTVVDSAGRTQLIAGKGSPVVVISVDNTPTRSTLEWLRDLDGNERAQAPAHVRNAPPLIEVTAPPLGLIAMHGQMGRMAERRLARLAGTVPGAFIELRFPRFEDRRQPSMNWQLDRDSQELMKAASVLPGDGRLATVAPVLQASPPSNVAHEILQANLVRLRAWIAKSPLRESMPGASEAKQ
jgi:hypothetical protein